MACLLFPGPFRSGHAGPHQATLTLQPSLSPNIAIADRCIALYNAVLCHNACWGHCLTLSVILTGLPCGCHATPNGSVNHRCKITYRNPCYEPIILNHRLDISNSIASTREKKIGPPFQILRMRSSSSLALKIPDLKILIQPQLSHSPLFHRGREGVPLARAGPAEAFPGDAEIYSSPTLPIILLAHERASHRILYTALKCHPLDSQRNS